MLAALGRLEAWLDSLVAGFEAAAADVETARVAQQAAEVLQQKLLREGPLTPGETLPPQYQALTEAVVAGPAALGRAGIGRLEVGATGDATVLELAEGDFEYRDVLGEVRAGRQRLKARGLVLAGRWWHPPRA
jgi:cytosine/adenosine deaminase-related metal-dependent hydrolase